MFVKKAATHFRSQRRIFSSQTKIRNIVLLVKDTKASANFYQNALGVSIIGQSETMAQLDTGGTPIILKVKWEKDSNTWTLLLCWGSLLISNLSSKTYRALMMSSVFHYWRIIIKFSTSVWSAMGRTRRFEESPDHRSEIDSLLIPYLMHYKVDNLNCFASFRWWSSTLLLCWARMHIVFPACCNSSLQPQHRRHSLVVSMWRSHCVLL